MTRIFYKYAKYYPKKTINFERDMNNKKNGTFYWLLVISYKKSQGMQTSFQPFSSREHLYK